MSYNPDPIPKAYDVKVGCGHSFTEELVIIQHPTRLCLDLPPHSEHAVLALVLVQNYYYSLVPP